MSLVPKDNQHDGLSQTTSVLTAAGLPPVVAKAWLQSWKWAAITVAVVTSPVIGKVAKVSAERFAGTIAGTAASA